MKNIVLLIFLLIGLHVNAQIKNFKDLVLPDVSLHRFQMSNSIGLSLNAEELDFSFPISASLNGYNNKRYRQTFYSVSFNNIINQNNEDFNVTKNRFRTSASINHTRYNSKYHFVRLSTYINYNTEYQSTKSQTTQNIERTGYMEHYSTVAIGKGRLEPLDWAIRAGFLNKNLVKSNAIDQDLPEDVLLELAKTMAREDRSRFYENRFYNIRRIKAIDSVMVKNGISFNELEFYTTLSDQYFFAPYRGTTAGSRFEIKASTFGYEGSGSFDSDSLPSYSERIQDLNYDIEASYEYHLPQSLHLYHSFSTSLSLRNNLVTNMSTLSPNLLDFNPSGEYIFTRLSYTFQWVPTTRTQLYFRTKGDYRIFSEENSFMFNTDISLNYFVNRRLSYNINGSYQYQTNNNKLTNTTEAEYALLISGGFRYQIW